MVTIAAPALNESKVELASLETPRVSAFQRRLSWIGRVAEASGGSPKQLGVRSEEFIARHCRDVRLAAIAVNHDRAGGSGLSGPQVEAVLHFYDLKLERQMRGLFLLAAGRTFDALLSKIDASVSKLEARKFAGRVPLQFSEEREPIAMLLFGSEGARVELRTGGADHSSTMTLPELRRLRRDALCLFAPESLSKSQAKVVAAYRNSVRAQITDELRSGRTPDRAALEDLNRQGFRDVMTEVKALLHNRAPEDSQRPLLRELESTLRRTDQTSWSKIFRVIASHPSLLRHFEDQLESFAENRLRFSERKVREVVGIVSAMKGAGIDPEAPMLDLCCGAGDLTLLLNEIGFNVKGIDISTGYLRSAKIYQRILGESGTELIANGDILRGPLPVAVTWVSKHPCAPGAALPDSIIDRFAESSAENLFLLTCCANKSVGCCPPAYKELGLTTDDAWNDACARSSESGDVAIVQSAMREINEVRLEAIRQRYGDRIEASLVEIPGSDMNQMLVLRKR